MGHEGRLGDRGGAAITALPASTAPITTDKRHEGKGRVAVVISVLLAGDHGERRQAQRPVAPNSSTAWAAGGGALARGLSAGCEPLALLCAPPSSPPRPGDEHGHPGDGEGLAEAAGVAQGPDDGRADHVPEEVLHED